MSQGLALARQLKTIIGRHIKKAIHVVGQYIMLTAVQYHGVDTCLRT